jgi:hypothetical protein
MNKITPFTPDRANIKIDGEQIDIRVKCIDGTTTGCSGPMSNLPMELASAMYVLDAYSNRLGELPSTADGKLLGEVVVVWHPKFEKEFDRFIWDDPGKWYAFNDQHRALFDECYSDIEAMYKRS